MARQPEVVTGYRGPRDESRPAAPASPARVIPEGKTVFQFVASRYMLQLTAPRALVLPDGRIQPGERPLVIKAEEGFKTLDNVADAKAIKLIKDHRYYGTDFWDYADTIKQLAKAKTDQAIAVLADPEARERIIEALKQMGEDVFKLQPKGKQKNTPAAEEAGE